MPFLPGLAVVFVGVVGGGHSSKVDHQVKALVKDLHVTAKALPENTVRTLTRHKDGTKEIIKRLHSDGVVSFEVIGNKELRLVTYDGDGALKTYLELSLESGALASDDLQTVRESIADDFTSLHATTQVAAAEPEIEMDAPAAKPLAKAVAKPAPVAAMAKTAPAAKAAAIDPVDDEMPSNLGKPAQKIAQKPAAAPAPAPAEETKHEAAATETADASATVSLDEIEAATGSTDGSSGGGGSDAEVHTAATADAPLHIGASVGVGVTGRLFSPGPTTITGYSSTPVGLVRADGHIDPTANLRIAVLGEKTLSMSTPMSSGNMAPTSIARWEAMAGYTLVHGRVEIAPQVGFGRRTFSIDSTDPSRSPDGEYNYLIAGVNAAMPLGAHVAVRGAALFEPVVSGAEPTEMALGDASRWALDLGAAVELHFTHVFARVGADWQRFSWSWDMAGTRGAGGAIDNYASGTLSVGADY